MAVSGKISTLFADQEKTTPIFPRTKLKAISNDDGIGLDAILSQIDLEGNAKLDELDERIDGKRIYGLDDIIDTFPTTMKDLTWVMPDNSIIIADMRDIVPGAKNEITDFGYDSTTGIAVIFRGYSTWRIGMLVIYCASNATTAVLRVGNYAADTNTTNWKKLGDEAAAYPVGAIYMSVKSTSPASLFGGTWTQLKNRFLIGAGDTYSNGATGGEKNHTLTVAEMPSHRHYLTFGSSDNTGRISTKQIAPGIEGDTLYEDVISPITKTGGGEAHNNMPPYLAVYMWKRTE